MDRMGIGKVYTGAVPLDVQSCAFERGEPIELVLEEGDEDTNRVRLRRTMTTRAPEQGKLGYRCASLADCAAVVDLVERAYRGESSRAGWTTEADLLGGQRTDAGDVASIIASDDARIVLASLGDELVGCVLVRREATGAYVGMLAVDPRGQARGIGRALLVEAEARARREFHAARTRMTVIEQRPELIAWYERRGYVRTGETEPFPYGNRRFGLPKRDDLRFVVLAKSLVGGT